MARILLSAGLKPAGAGKSYRLVDAYITSFAAVTRVAPRGSGDGRVQVVYSTEGTQLHAGHQQADAAGQQLISPADHPMARQAYAKQQAPPSLP